MNTSQLIESVAAQTGLSKKDAAVALTAVLDVIRRTVATGDAVRLAHFGTFQACWRSARQGRNPDTGETIDIPATRVAKFSPAKAFKEAVK